MVPAIDPRRAAGRTAPHAPAYRASRGWVVLRGRPPAGRSRSGPGDAPLDGVVGPASSRTVFLPPRGGGRPRLAWPGGGSGEQPDRFPPPSRGRSATHWRGRVGVPASSRTVFLPPRGGGRPRTGVAGWGFRRAAGPFSSPLAGEAGHALAWPGGGSGEQPDRFPPPSRGRPATHWRGRVGVPASSRTVFLPPRGGGRP